MRQQFAWNFAAEGVGLLLPSLLLILLARVLDPEDFGVFALLTIIIIPIQTIIVTPLSEAVIQSKREDIADFIFTTQLLVGLLSAALLFLAADSISALFSQPELAPPLRVSGLLLLVNPFVDTAIRLNMRNLAFRAVFVRRIVTPLGNAIISIPLACYGFKYWSLVWGQIGGFALAAVIVLAMGDWRPRLNFDYGKSITDIRFTAQMILQGAVRWVRSHSDNAILGYHIAVDSLGQYDLARRLANLPFGALVEPVAQVMYAVMSDKVRREEEIRSLVMLAQRRVLLISFPLCVFLVSNAEGLVLLVLGPKWIDITQLFALIAILGAIATTVRGNTEVFKALGRPEIMTKFMLIRAVFTLPIFLLLAPYGAYAMVAGMLALACFFSPVNIYITLRIAGISPLFYLKSVIMPATLLSSFIALSNFLLLQLPLDHVTGTFINAFVTSLLVFAGIHYWEPQLFKLKNIRTR